MKNRIRIYTRYALFFSVTFAAVGYVIFMLSAPFYILRYSRENKEIRARLEVLERKEYITARRVEFWLPTTPNRIDQLPNERRKRP